MGVLEIHSVIFTLAYQEENNFSGQICSSNSYLVSLDDLVLHQKLFSVLECYLRDGNMKQNYLIQFKWIFPKEW